jgi:hypothetical protein
MRPGVWSNIPQPGTSNSIEGRDPMGGQALSEKSVGTARLAQGPVGFDSGRPGRDSAGTRYLFCGSITITTVEMANPGLADTRLAAAKGRAMVEVAEIGQGIMCGSVPKASGPRRF